MLVDAHCHLQRVEDDLDRERIIKRAEEAEICMITCCHDSSNPFKVKKTLEIAQNHENVFPALGLYYFGGERLKKMDMYVDEEVVERAMNTIRKVAKNDKVIVAIGEVGLDYQLTKNDNEKKTQRELFEKFANLSGELDLPLIVHSSADAVGDVIEVLKKDQRPALLHGFKGSLEEAKEAISLGCLIAIWPKITYSKYLQALVSKLPLECFAFETDSPLSHSAPFPGVSRNEPANIVFTAQKIAEIKKIPLEKVEEVTTQSAAKFFNIPLGEALP